ncbi:MAG: hypothetical protein PHZ19_01405 [Candidatus Thermoplasmatota archaeon]|nr:hypothetical protein [Candidatus Thermoplasmatota archaeon]
MKRVKSRGIRVATKVQGERIRQWALRLRENPAMVLPECRDDTCHSGLFRSCAFSGLRKKLDGLRGLDREALARYADRRGLVGAVAGTMLLAEEERIPYLAARQMGGKTYVYAKRGEAEDEKLVAVQNFDDPHVRMLAVVDLAAKKNLHLYSVEDKMLCTGGTATPPPEFVSFVLHRLKLTDGACPHVRENRDRPHLALVWHPAGVTLRLCRSCATGNTLAGISQYLYSPRLRDEFTARVEGTLISCHQSCPDCAIEEALAVQVDDDMYVQNQMSDAEFIDNWKKKVQWNIEKMDTPVLVVNGTCYGRDVEAVLDALSPQPWEAAALRSLLPRLDRPLVIEEATPNKILSRYWDTHGQALVTEMAGERGNDLLRRHGRRTPSEILELAFQEKEKQDVLAHLPSFDALPPLADFAHRIATAHRVGGAREAVRVVHGEEMDVKKKAVAYAFLLAMDKAGGEQWRYGDMERDFGGHLEPYARRLLQETGDAYRSALQEMLTAAGSTRTVGG